MAISRVDVMDIIVVLREAELRAARESGSRPWIAYSVAALTEAQEQRRVEQRALEVRSQGS